MVSIVMPAYNEAEIIEDTVREWCTEVADRIPGCELIVVNDCSTDQTGDVLIRLTHQFPALRPLTPEHNGGHGRALRFGFDHARHDWIFQTDSDRQHVPADFWKLWQLREQNDFVFGIREERADGVTRACITTAMRLVNFFLWGLWLRDANCPFKLMRREAALQVLARIPRDSFVPMVMLAILCRKGQYRVTEVPVQHLPRTGGTASLTGMGRWVKVGTRCVRQLLAWRFSLNGGR